MIIRPIIPGHVLAYTWILGVTSAITAWLFGVGWNQVVGFLLFVIGSFLGDQATHLAQITHAQPAPTWLEMQQQRHTREFQFTGLVICSIGVATVLW